MSLSLHTLLVRILLAATLVAGAAGVNSTLLAKSGAGGGGHGGAGHAGGGFGGAKPFTAKPIAAKPALAKPNLGSLQPKLVNAKPMMKPNLGSSGGSAARTKAPGTAVPPNLVKHPINPGSIAATPFHPANPSGPIPTTPPINPNPPPQPYPKPWLPGSGPGGCFPGYCHPWIGIRVNLIGWRGGCYVPPIYAPIVTTPVLSPVVAGGTVIVNDNDTTIVNEAAAAPVALAGTLPEVMVGSQVSLVADNPGTTSGQMILEVNGLALACRIDTWAGTVTATLPGFGLAEKTPAKLHIVRADGTLARSQDVMLLPAAAK